MEGFERNSLEDMDEESGEELEENEDGMSEEEEDLGEEELKRKLNYLNKKEINNFPEMCQEIDAACEASAEEKKGPIFSLFTWILLLEYIEIEYIYRYIQVLIKKNHYFYIAEKPKPAPKKRVVRKKAPVRRRRKSKRRRRRRRRRRGAKRQVRRPFTVKVTPADRIAETLGFNHVNQMNHMNHNSAGMKTDNQGKHLPVMKKSASKDAHTDRSARSAGGWLMVHMWLLNETR